MSLISLIHKTDFLTDITGSSKATNCMHYRYALPTAASIITDKDSVDSQFLQYEEEAPLMSAPAGPDAPLKLPFFVDELPYIII